MQRPPQAENHAINSKGKRQLGVVEDMERAAKASMKGIRQWNRSELSPYPESSHFSSCGTERVAERMSGSAVTVPVMPVLSGQILSHLVVLLGNFEDVHIDFHDLHPRNSIFVAPFYHTYYGHRHL